MENMTFQGRFAKQNSDKREKAPEEERLNTADLVGDHKQSFVQQLELKKQANSANLNMISYQTANFGARARQNEASAEKSGEK